jgi:hypothetical protein
MMTMIGGENRIQPSKACQTASSRMVSRQPELCRTIRDLKQSFIQPEELQRYDGYWYLSDIILILSSRISSFEFLDETDLVLSYYAMSLGLFLSEPETQQGWGHWRLKQKTEMQNLLTDSL